MTRDQFDSLEKWLEWGYDHGKKEVLFLTADRDMDAYYYFDENFPEDIIKKVKRFYSSGKFYEKLVRK